MKNRKLKVNLEKEKSTAKKAAEPVVEETPQTPASEAQVEQAVEGCGCRRTEKEKQDVLIADLLKLKQQENLKKQRKQVKNKIIHKLMYAISVVILFTADFAYSAPSAKSCYKNSNYKNILLLCLELRFSQFLYMLD